MPLARIRSMARVASIGKNRPDPLLEELQHCGINSGAGPFTLCFEILKVKEEWEETNDKGPGAKPDHDYHPTSIIGLKVQCIVVKTIGFSCWKSCKKICRARISSNSRASRGKVSTELLPVIPAHSTTNVTSFDAIPSVVIITATSPASAKLLDSGPMLT